MSIYTPPPRDLVTFKSQHTALLKLRYFTLHTAARDGGCVVWCEWGFQRVPHIPPLNLAVNDGSPPAPEPSGADTFSEENEDDSLFLSSGLLTSAILERTLPMTDIDLGVLVNTIPGNGAVCRCFADSNLTVVAGTTLENVVTGEK